MPDVNTLRGLGTLVALLAFVALVGWAWSSQRKSTFDRAARMPLDDDADLGGK